MVRFASFELSREQRSTLDAIEMRYKRNGKAQAPSTDLVKGACMALLNYGMLDEVHGVGGRIGYVPASFPVIEGRVNR